ncbi:Uma2 family endonuclease [Streptomyces sp. SID12501]|uniref:Uma2 family endonuclease n=1 Tax=Streptomyces sp. SID12501 TaxID=2706042 RepID=A0A6B3BZ10_9ACTN|nr:Uma2 family endonuclease [Streptomyces sp. SID12501]NEC89641.1 Uma2 family endonuclease [Streptomyces sp. SID12501]
MTAPRHEVFPVMTTNEPASVDEILWETWKAMELPEGYRAEVIEGVIEVSSTGRRRHAVLISRTRRALETHLFGGDYVAHQMIHVIHRRKSWIPDLLLGPEDLDEILDEDGLGVDAAVVPMVIEVVSPGRRNIERDRVRKRREYARAGIAVYVIIDDFDEDGAVVVLGAPNPGKATYEDEHRVLYGTDAVISSGPAKGFVIGEAITRA